MSDLATPGANALLDGSASIGTLLYVQAHSDDPGTNGTANVIGGVDRKSFNRGAAVAGVASNTTLIEWLDWPGVDNITHITIWSASTGGTCWFVDDIIDKVTSIGATVRIAIGALTITFPVWT